jgi:lactate dehydrogenase-like 2-hydroxyacid dehydrogenase
MPDKTITFPLESMGLCLRNKVLGLHGYGRIARELAGIARDGLKMRIQFFDPYVSITTDKKISTLEELYSTSDIVSINVPLNQETQNTINSKLLSLVKQDFILINTARGLIVNTEDLLQELQKGRIYYGCDVWREHDDFDSELISDRTIQTNYLAFFTQEAVLAIILQTLESYNGNPRKENIL